MHIFKRGQTYWYEFVKDGQRYRRSSGVKSRRAAEDIAMAFKTALNKGDVGITERKPAPGFSDAMRTFLRWSEHQHRAHPRTTARYRVSSAALVRSFGKTPLDRIRKEDVEEFKLQRAGQEGKRTKRPLRPATINRELAALKAMFNHFLDSHPGLRNPASRVKLLAEENQQERVISFAEQRVYMTVATPVLRDVATIIAEQGMRPEEVYTLRGSQVDIDREFLKVLRGKTAAARRRIDLTPETIRILRSRIDEYGSGYLFPHKHDPSRPMPKVNNAHDRAIRDAKLEPFTLYTWRHTFATRAAEAGIDAVTLAKMLGHSRLNMVTRYAHPQEAHQRSAMQRLAVHNAAREISEAGVPTVQ